LRWAGMAELFDWTGWPGCHGSLHACSGGGHGRFFSHGGPASSSGESQHDGQYDSGLCSHSLIRRSRLGRGFRPS
jgi:hypothetical protein